MINVCVFMGILEVGGGGEYEYIFSEFKFKVKYYIFI